MSMANKTRNILTSIGIFTSVFLFATGSVITESYYNNLFNIIESTRDNTIVLTSNHEEIEDITALLPNVTYEEDAVLQNKIPVMSRQIYKGCYENVLAAIHGVTGMQKGHAAGYEDNEYLPFDTELIKGRLISQSDISSGAMVAVIDEFTARLLFEDEDPVGKMIKLDAGNNGSNVSTAIKEELEVIGVISDTYVSSLSSSKLQKALNKNDGSNIEVDVSVYVPISVTSRLFEYDTVYRYYVFYPDAYDYPGILAAVTKLCESMTAGSRTYEYSTKEMKISDLKVSLADTRRAINLLMMILSVISGISIMGVIFFSVKERIPEIGIRKAYGAAGGDILFQFVTEIFIISLIVSVFAVCVSFYVCSFLEGYINSLMTVDFKINIRLYKLAIPVLAGTLEAVLAGFIPGIYAANIKPADSLRFE